MQAYTDMNARGDPAAGQHPRSGVPFQRRVTAQLHFKPGDFVTTRRVVTTVFPSGEVIEVVTSVDPSVLARVVPGPLTVMVRIGPSTATLLVVDVVLPVTTVFIGDITVLRLMVALPR